MEKTQLVPDVERLAKTLEHVPEPVANPFLIVVSGLPGTGKSYFSQKLADRLPVLILESDVLRKVLFPLPDYSAAESIRLFRAIHPLIENLLRKGIPLILDATNLSEHHREHLYNIADRLKAKLILVRLVAPPEVVKERLESRIAKGEGTSEADWEVYEKMKALEEEILRKHYVIDTSRDITPLLDKIVREAKR